MTDLISYMNLKSWLDEQGVTLVAVSKTKSVDEIRRVHALGQRVFGENRARELEEKQPELPGDIQWHMIGHLQSNKVKYIAPFISMIESVDSIKLLDRIDREAAKADRQIDVLLQVRIAEEETKYGFAPDDLRHAAADLASDARPHVRIRGLMGMASFVENTEKERGEFDMHK
ncbi:MAG: YggS family pyridoxal phosphate-dependent enzyme, partial [Saprospiraceae bacterium]|nr:YggS family pyridoxal phosphate-dependent enzyme [Saprospiraceae bacterium]